MKRCGRFTGPRRSQGRAWDEHLDVDEDHVPRNKLEQTCGVPIFEHGYVVVCDREGVSGLYQVRVVNARMLEVVRKGGQQERVALEVGHGRSDPPEHQESGMRHIDTVLKIVVRVLGRIVPPHDVDERADGDPMVRIADQSQVLKEAQDHRR